MVIWSEIRLGKCKNDDRLAEQPTLEKNEQIGKIIFEYFEENLIDCVKHNPE